MIPRNISCLIFAAMMLSVNALTAFGQQAGATQTAGGRGGSPFADSQPAQGARITEVRVRAGERVDAVQAIYTLSDGRTNEGVRHGGTGGRENVFRLDGDEYITGISGRYGVTVDCIRIHTNKRTSPTFGGDGGDNDFRIDVPSGSQAVGFVGRSGEAVDSIGLTYAARAVRSYYSQMGWQGQVSATALAGGRGGSAFTDVPPAQAVRIAEVRVRSGERVDAVQVVYALSDGRTIEGTRHGGGGGRENTFALESDEYITGISGRFGEVLDSLRVHTNKRTSPTFGGGGGDRDFRLDVPSGSQAIGFVGRSGEAMDAVGLSYAARVVPNSYPQTGLQGQGSVTSLAGGRGGSGFTDVPPAQAVRIAEVRVRSGERVDAVQVIYAFSDGRTIEGTRHGGWGGRENTLALDADEYITGISGRYGNTVDSIRIHTNKRTSPTYGGAGGNNDFQIDVPSGSQAIGFAGRSGETVDAVGLSYVARAVQSYYPQAGVQGQGSVTSLAGGRGGSAFMDSAPNTAARVSEVRVRAGERIVSVQLVYALADGRLVEGTRRGGTGGREYSFALDPDEFITGISGRYGNTVDSLRIHTNRRMSPLYGGSGGDRDFRIDVPSGSQAIGFVGRSGEAVDSVGLSYATRGQQGYSSQAGLQGQGSVTSLAGGRGGSAFTDVPPAQAVRIAEVRARAGERIASLQMVYVLADGRLVEGTRRGGTGGREYSFALDPDEYITGISGRCGDAVDSLRIHTNKRTSPLYGGSGGDRDFRVDVPAGNQATGWAGRAGSVLNAVGLTYGKAPVGGTPSIRSRRVPGVQ